MQSQSAKISTKQALPSKKINQHKCKIAKLNIAALSNMHDSNQKHTNCLTIVRQWIVYHQKTCKVYLMLLYDQNSKVGSV